MSSAKTEMVAPLLHSHSEQDLESANHDPNDDLATDTFFIGDISLDRYYRADYWPALADRLAMEVVDEQIGGMVANAARIHAGFGQPTQFISILNHGALSDVLETGMKAAHVGMSHIIRHADEPEPQTVVFIVGDEDVIFWAKPSTFPIALRADTLEALKSPGYLYSTAVRLARLLGPAGESAAHILQALSLAGRKTILDLDADGMRANDEEFVHGAHTVLMNRHGFNRSAITDVTAWLTAHEITELIVTLGSQGSLHFDHGGKTEVPGLKVDVVNVTGAGDTFGGAYTYALTQNWPVAKRLSFANTAAARSVTRFGPAGGIATLADIASFASFPS